MNTQTLFYKSVKACRFIGLMLVTALALGGTAKAQDTSITLDDLKPDPNLGLALGDQYLSKGVKFETGYVIPRANALTPPNVAFGVRSGELGSPYIRGVFTNPHHRYVTVWVENNVAEAVYLTAFDLGGNKLGEVNATRTAQPGTFRPLTISTPARNAAVFIVGGNPGGSTVYVDNLRFDNIGTLEGPDFYFYPVGGYNNVQPGGPPTIVNVNLGRRAGSTGGINISVTGLPTGVTVDSITPNPVTGNNFKIALKANASVSPTRDNYNKPFTITGTPTASAGAYGPRSVSATATVVGSYDAQIVGIEVTQGIQPVALQQPAAGGPKTVSYSQPSREGLALAQDATTAARVFVDLRGIPNGITSLLPLSVTLNGYRDGQLLAGSPLYPFKSTSPVVGPDTVTDDMRMGKTGGEYAFQLPSEWARGIITLTATVSQPPQFTPVSSYDCCSDNNAYTLTDIPFTRTRELIVLPFAMDVLGEALETPENVLAQARNMMPVGDAQFKVRNWIGHIDITDLWNDKDKTPTKRGAAALDRLRDRADDVGIIAGTNAMTIGIFPGSDANQQMRAQEWSGCDGPFWECSEIPGGIVRNKNRPFSSVTHEIGHFLGRNHAGSACGADAEKSPFDAWPPDNMGLIQGIGFDRRDGSIYVTTDKQNIYDYMSYCGNNGNDDPDKWISVKGWTELMTALAVGKPGEYIPLPQVLPLAERRSRPLQADGPMLIVRGRVDTEGSVLLTKVAPGTPPAPILPDADSPYHAVAKDAAGNVLADVGMKREEIHTHGEGEAAYLSAQIPATDVATVEIVKDGATVAERLKSANAPAIADLSVEADKVRAGVLVSRVTWNATDADNDALTAKVDYSADGGKTWSPVYAGANTGQASLQSTLLATSAQGIIAVRISDGFNETRVESAPFATNGFGPTVRIFSPAQDATLQAGATVNLSGEATDDAGHLLSNADLNWYDGATLIGSGETVTVSDLAPGTHTLRLTGSDAQGRTRSAKVRVQVNR